VWTFIYLNPGKENIKWFIYLAGYAAVKSTLKTREFIMQKVGKYIPCYTVVKKTEI
jgi:hypothetical protein